VSNGGDPLRSIGFASAGAEAMPAEMRAIRLPR
jgi:hypothetical protein